MAEARRPSAARGLAAISGASIISIVVTGGIAIAMPLALDLHAYAYWQLFSLYLSFSGFFVLGFNDGMYQKFAQRSFGAAEMGTLAAYKWIVLALGLISCIAVTTISSFLPNDKGFAVVSVGICLSFFGMTGFLTYVNQLAGRLYQVALASVVERVSLLLATIALMASGCHDYRLFIIVCIGASVFKLLYLGWSARSVVMGRSRYRMAWRRDFLDIIALGFPIMLSILFSGSIVVPSRLVVERHLGPEPFALYSFAMTIVFVTGTVLSSVSQAAFPLLARVPREDQVAAVKKVHSSLVVVGSLLLTAYFAADVAIQFLYPKFTGSLEFLGYLFPLVIFQTKYILLLSNFLRVRGRIGRLVLVATTGMATNLLAGLFVVERTHSVVWVAVASLAAYGVWQAFWWRAELGGSGPMVHLWDWGELAVVIGFLGCVQIPILSGVSAGARVWVSFLAYVAFLAVVGLLGRTSVITALAPLIGRVPRLNGS